MFASPQRPGAGARPRRADRARRRAPTLGDAGLRSAQSTTPSTPQVAGEPGHQPGPGRRRVRRPGHDRRLHAVSSGRHPTKVPLRGRADRRARPQSALAGRASQPGLPAGGVRPAEGHRRQDRPRRRHQGAARAPTSRSTISKGPQKVPDVVGLQQAEAEQMLSGRAASSRQVSPTTARPSPRARSPSRCPAAGQTAAAGRRRSLSLVVDLRPDRRPPTSPPTSEPTSPPTSLPTVATDLSGRGAGRGSDVSCRRRSAAAPVA